MKFFLGMISILLSVSYVYVGCSDVRFYDRPLASCDNIDPSFNIDSCKVTSSGTSTIDFTVKSGLVDIVFMVDNSGSMHVEQLLIADKIADPGMNPNFFDHINGLDYRIAMVTSDTTSTSVSAGGRFLPYPNGDRWIYREVDANGIVNQTPDIINEFRGTIERQESLDCATAGYTASACPSADERGIQALIQSVMNPAQRSFFRTGAHLAVIIVSDEDERSNGGKFAGYPLIAGQDFPEDLVDTVTNYLGAAKTLSAHSIIIRPDHVDPATNNFVPQDVSCKNQQDNQLGGILKGFYGEIYKDLSLPTSANGLLNRGGLVTGSIGSICSNDYGSLLSGIASVVSNNTKKFVKLPCTPKTDGVDVTYIPDPGGVKNPSWDGNNVLTLDPVPDPSVGTQVKLTVRCK